MKFHECVSLPSVRGQDSVTLECPPISWNTDRHLLPESRDQLLCYHPEITLFAPQIPPNTGTVARLCAAFSCRLNLIEPLGFTITQKSLNRAGLDYWPFVDVTLFTDWEQFVNMRPNRRFVFIETGSHILVQDFLFLPGDILVFGSETTGIPQSVIQRMQNSNNTNAHIALPMYNTGVRSFNLSNSVSMVAFNAISKLHP